MGSHPINLIIRFLLELSGDSGGMLPLIPDLTCRVFRLNPATQSGFNLPLFSGFPESKMNFI